MLVILVAIISIVIAIIYVRKAASVKNGDTPAASEVDYKSIMKVQSDREGNLYAEDMTEAVAVTTIADAKQTPRKYLASDQIRLADKDSGYFQVGDLMFKLPVKVQLMTDNGVQITLVNDKIPKNTSDFVLNNTAEHTCIFSYKGISFQGNLFNIENHRGGTSAITDMYAIQILEDSTNSEMALNTDHLYFPGGVSIYDTLDSIMNLYGESDHKIESELKTSDTIHTFGYMGLFTIDDANCIKVGVHSHEDTIYNISSRKNIFEK